MSNIHYGLTEKKETTEFDDSTLKSDISTLKSNLAAEKLKVSTNKTNISVNKAAITSEKTKLDNTRTLLNNLSSQVTTVENNVASNKLAIAAADTTAINANTRSKSNLQKITAVESKAETNRLGILVTPTSIVNYHLYIPDLAKVYRTTQNFPNVYWPPPLIQFGSIDTKTTFRLVGVTCDEDVVIPSANFSVTFLLKVFTNLGAEAEAVIATLSLSTFQVPNKPYFCINRDYKLRTIFPTQNIKCGKLYIKHNLGARDITVESIVSCAIVQF